MACSEDPSLTSKMEFVMFGGLVTQIRKRLNIRNNDGKPLLKLNAQNERFLALPLAKAVGKSNWKLI